jgi:chromosome segregation ATPase
VKTLKNNKRQIKTLTEQLASHATMIEGLHKPLASISSEINGLKHQAAGLDKALSKLADNQATLLTMSAGKPQGHMLLV